MKKDESKAETHVEAQRCPSCGYCPTCGRSNAPYWGWTRPYPTWPQYPWWGTTTVTYDAGNRTSTSPASTTGNSIPVLPAAKGA